MELATLRLIGLILALVLVVANELFGDTLAICAAPTDLHWTKRIIFVGRIFYGTMVQIGYALFTVWTLEHFLGLDRFTAFGVRIICKKKYLQYMTALKTIFDILIEQIPSQNAL